MLDVSYSVVIPTRGGLRKAEEYCVVSHAGTSEVILIHDYDQLFKTPGLYEEVYFTLLHGRGPEVISAALADAMQHRNVSPSNYRVVELGAGNGVGARALQDQGFSDIIGIDRNSTAQE